MTKASEGMDTVREAQGRPGRGLELLSEAENAFAGYYTYRKTRERCKKYYFGDQWGDWVKDPDSGRYMKEEELIRKRGNTPLKNNLMRRLGRNVLGAYLNQDKEPICIARDRQEQELGEVMTTTLQYNRQLNKTREMNARSLEEYLIGGLVVHKTWYGWRNGKLECWTDSVDTTRFFTDAGVKDVRGWDVCLIGEIHDYAFNRLCELFAKTEADYEFLKRRYAQSADRRYVSNYMKQFGTGVSTDADSFYYPADESKCRVIEVWRKEMKPRWMCTDPLNGEVFKCDMEDYAELVEEENERRKEMCAGTGAEPVLIEASWFMDNYWYYYYLTPFGDILSEGETPYQHGGHPYVFKAYPFIDGEIHSFVNDFLDQQIYVNRLLMLYEWMIRVSGKGNLMMTVDMKPDGWTWEQVAESYSRVGGIVVFKPNKQGILPQQLANNCTNVGITDLLNIQLKFFEDISGVNGALQGKSGYANTSGRLYEQQVQNGTTSLMDLFESYSSFELDESYKVVKNIQQYYDNARMINVTGKRKPVWYDPGKVQDIEYDLSIVHSQTTPVYRDASNQLLLQIWQTGQITLEQLLEVGEFPFADELLQKVKSAKQEQETEARQMQGQQGAQQLYGEIQNGAVPEINGNDVVQ